MHLNWQKTAIYSEFFRTSSSLPLSIVYLKCLRLILILPKDNDEFKLSNLLPYIVDICRWQKFCSSSFWSYISVFVFFVPQRLMLCVIFAESLVDESSQIWRKIARKPPSNLAGIFMSVKIILSAMQACNINTPLMGWNRVKGKQNHCVKLW